MRILDEVTNKSLKNITLYLTFSEATELLDSLAQIIKKPINNHDHISSEDYQKEITICIYDKKNLMDLMKDQKK
jgi:hypothetical protein